MNAPMSFDVADPSLWTMRLLFSLTLLALVAVLLQGLLRQSSAAVRHRVWGLIVVAALLLPIPLLFLPELRLGWWATGKNATASAAATTSESSFASTESEANLPPDTTIAQVEPSPPSSNSPERVLAPSATHEPKASSAEATLIARANETGSVEARGNGHARSWLFLLAAPTLFGFWRIVSSLMAGRRIVARSAEIADPACRQALTMIGEHLIAEAEISSRWSLPGGGVQRLQIRQSSETAIPLCVGWWRPCILLPEGWRTWSNDTMRAVVAHELSHVLRHDVLWQLVARLACALYWFHPLAWVAAWRMRIERETACDDCVLRAGEKPAAYARALLSVAEALNARPFVPAAAIAMAACSGLEQRVRAILAADRRRTPVSRSVGRVLVLVMIVAVSIAAALSPLSRDAVPDEKDSVPLAQAVKEFNEKIEERRRSTVMPTLPKSPLSQKSVLPLASLTAADGGPAPLTVDEVVKAIERWNRSETPPVDDETYGVFRKIVETKRLPSGATFELLTDWITEDKDDRQKYRYHVWWLDLSVMRNENEGYVYRLRDVQLSRKLIRETSRGYSWLIDPIPVPPVGRANGIDDLQYIVEEEADGKVVVLVIRRASGIAGDYHVIGFDTDGNRHEFNVRQLATRDSDSPHATVVERYSLDVNELQRARLREIGIEKRDAKKPDEKRDKPPIGKPDPQKKDSERSDAATTTAPAIATSGSGRSSERSKEEETVAATEPAATPPAIEPGVVTGEVVRAEDGAPVPGTLVLLRESQLYRATTDEKGKFRFEKIPPGQYAIWAHKDELATPKERLVGSKSADAAGGAFPPIRLSMKRGKQIRFTVKSAVTGAALAGAEIRFGYPDRRKTATDAIGAAVVAALLPEKYEVTVEAAGHAREVREIDLATPTDTIDLSYALRAGGVVRGTVVDESGRPLEKASVTYYTGETSYWDHGSAFFTDAQGQFSHLHLPLNKPVKVAARLQDYLPQEKEFLLTDGEREGKLEFKLQPRSRDGSISGVVTDLQGKPLAGATVRNHGSDLTQKREATTDAEGKFVLHDLLKGHAGHEIVVRARKFATVMQKVKPGPESAPGQVEVRLEPGHTIRGRVLDPSGRAVKGAYVSANGYGDFGIGETVRTDDEGGFAFDSLPAKTRFMIHGINYPIVQDQELKLDGTETVVVKLESFASLAGRVVDADTGKPVEEFRIRADFCLDRRPGDAQGSYPNTLGEPGMTFQSKEGAFLINGMSKGVPLVIVVEAAGYERSVFPRVVAGTSEGDLVKEVALKKRDGSKLATLTGRVVDHRENPAAGVHLRLIVTAEPSNGNDDNQFNWVLINSGQLGRKSYVERYLSAVSNAQGAFEFKELPPGKFLQMAFWGDKVPKGRSLVLAKTKPGVSQSTVLKIPEPARIAGSFDPQLFAGAGEIQVNYDDEAFLSYRATMGDKKNTFTLENLPPGKCHVSITSQPERHKDNPSMSTVRSLASRKLTIEPGQTYEIQFTNDDIVKPR